MFEALVQIGLRPKEEFRARFFHPGAHMLLQRMCTVSWCFWGLDILHISDYHGVSAHCIANVLHDIVRDNELSVRSQDVAWERRMHHVTTYVLTRWGSSTSGSGRRPDVFCMVAGAFVQESRVHSVG